jgi:protein SHQ1
MLLTPEFTISQDDNFVIIHIRVPYIKVSNAEVILEGRDFSFYCQPYLLKLTFPKDVHDEEDTYHAKYDPNESNGMLTVTVKKMNVGEHFPDLDLLSTIMKKRKVDRLIENLDDEGCIEVLHSENFVDNHDELDDAQNNAETAKLSLKQHCNYGFNMQYSSVLTHLSEAMYGTLEIYSPENLSVIDRRAKRILRENELFDPYRYLGDFVEGEEDPLYHAFMKFNPLWNEQWDVLLRLEKEQKKNLSTENNANENKWNLRLKSFEEVGGFNEKENDVLRNKLHQKEYLITSPTRLKSLYYNLIDILFAYCYENRLSQAEFNSESPHNITRLSSTLSWLDQYEEYPFESSISSSFLSSTKSIEDSQNLFHVISFSFRRFIIFSYLRIWKFGRKILTDITKILLLGKRTILKIFLQLFLLYEKTDTHYLLNKLWIEDYLIFIQHEIKDEELFALGNLFNQVKNDFEKNEKISKDKMGFYLNEIENWALTATTENEDGESETDDDDDDNEAEDSEDDEESESDEESVKEGNQGKSSNSLLTEQSEVTQDNEGKADEEEKEEEEDEEGNIPRKFLNYSQLILENDLLKYLRVQEQSSLLPGDSEPDHSAILEKLLLKSAGASAKISPVEEKGLSESHEVSPPKLPSSSNFLLKEVSTQRKPKNNDNSLVNPHGTASSGLIQEISSSNNDNSIPSNGDLLHELHEMTLKEQESREESSTSK